MNMDKKDNYVTKLLSYKFIAIIVVQIKAFKDNSEYFIITEKTKSYVLEKESIQKTLH